MEEVASVPKIVCVRCGHTYVPRKQGSPCPKCIGNPYSKGRGKGWRKGLKGSKIKNGAVSIDQ